MSPTVPRLLLIVDRDTVGGAESWIDRVRRLAPLRLPVPTALQLRVKDPSEGPRTALLERGIEAARDSDPALPLIVNGTVEEARRLGVDGAHWPERAIPSAPPDTSGLLVGASVHGPGEALARAEAAGADYVVFAPVFPPRSKPGEGRGLESFRKVVETSRLPVLALGGVDTARARDCLDAGAAGVAVVGAVMLAEDPAAAAREIADRLV